MEEPLGSSQALRRYAEMLRESPHNLLSPKALSELETRHLPESVAFAGALPDTKRLLDLGSGGGLPGMVIAIVRPDIEVHLLEATGKKARFLEEVGVALGVQVVVHHGRAEELARPPNAAAFDRVTARAVAPLERLVGWASPYLQKGGMLHAIKGDRWEAELGEARAAITRAGLRVVSTPDAGGSGQPEEHPTVVVLERLR